MTQGHRQCICRIILNRAFNTQQQAHHVLNLRLVGPAAANDGLLDRAWAVFCDWYLAGYRRTNRRATGLAKFDRRGSVMRNENGFDRRLVRFVFFDQLLQLGKNNTQPLCKLARSGLDSAVVNRGYPVTVNLDNTYAGYSRTGINTEYAQVFQVYASAGISAFE